MDDRLLVDAARSEDPPGGEVTPGDSVPSPGPAPADDPGQVTAELLARMASLEKQVGFLPSQIRLLGGKVDSLTTAITEPRFRALLLGVLTIYDLVDQVLRTPPSIATDADRGHLNNYQVLRTQVRMLLGLNGLVEIPGSGVFDPLVHRALQSVPVDDPAKSDQVLEVVRPGFRTGQAVLRYAEVVVGRFTPVVPNNDVPPDAAKL